VKREIPLLLTFLSGIFMVLGFFIPHNTVQVAQNEIQAYGTILLAASVLLGIMNLFRINLIKVSRREGDWPFKLILLVCMTGMFLAGMTHPFNLDSNDTAAGTTFDWLFTAVFSPLQSSMFALLAFFIASAAFRAFRIRTFEAGLLAVAGILVMFGRVPLGAALWPSGHGFPGVNEIQEWIMTVPTVAARRAIFIGAALGAISIGLRVILGFERAHLGSGE
jgi:hypothetical protein